jgi:hypothetical protein
MTFCSDFSLDELFELECPVTISNGTFSIDCTSNVDNGGCTYTEHVVATGTYSGTTLTVEATVTVTNENPAGCSGEPACAGVSAVIERVGDAPSACNYAEANTIEATVSGGPFNGNAVFQAFGFVSGIPGNYNWSISAGANTSFAAKRPVGILNQANLDLQLQALDENALPATFDITVQGVGKPAGTAADGIASYFDQTTEGAYFYSTGGSGSITVQEVSGSHIAGTINSLNIEGMEYVLGGGDPVSATRTLSGGFYVLQGGFPSKGQEWCGWIRRLVD